MASEQFSLCWDNFHKNMSSGMNSLLENEDLVDVTLAVQGKCLKAHKMVLSVCSPYFKELFKSNPCQHPIVFMKDVSYEALSDLLTFMYQGEVQVSQENLTTFIKTAEALQIKGLTGDGNGSADAEPEVSQEKTVHQVEEYKPAPRPKKTAPPPVVTSSPQSKRQRLSVSSSDSQSVPPPVTKTEPVPIALPETPVHFKMEPYDQSQSQIDETGDENFGDDTLDDNTVDDSEDYSMMEGGMGEEEPQAGTSTDGAGEGQATIYYGFGRKNPKLIFEGHEFRIDRTSDTKTFWLCGSYGRSKCKVRVIVTGEDTITVNNEHNHPPKDPNTQDLTPVNVRISKKPEKIVKAKQVSVSVIKAPTKDHTYQKRNSKQATKKYPQFKVNYESETKEAERELNRVVQEMIVTDQFQVVGGEGELITSVK